MRIIYTIVYCLIFPLIIIRLYWRSIKAPDYRVRVKERFAMIPKRRTSERLIWVHAVSVGETVAATPLVRQLMADHPDWTFCLTTMTPTGSRQVKKIFGDSVLHYYLPYDIPCFLQRFLNAVKPDMLIIMETELWPNMIFACEQRRIPVILANARMSARSMKGYRRFHALTQPMLQMLSAIAAQSFDDAERFRLLGAGKSNQDLSVTGSIKYDIVIQDAVRERLAQLRSQLALGDRTVIIFASTHPQEDERLLPIIKALWQADNKVLALVVPRHPERFDKVYGLCQNHNLNCVRISDSVSVSERTQVVLGDTMGDLMACYGLASIAFIGGSLIDHGGHNYLEAAAWSLPIVSGASVFNFQSIVDRLVDEKGLVLVNDTDELQQVLSVWLSNSAAANKVGEAASRVLLANQGALARLIAIIERYAA